MAYQSSFVREGDPSDPISSRALHTVAFTNSLGSTDRLFLLAGTRGNGFQAYRGSDGMRFGPFSSTSSSTGFIDDELS